MQRAEYITGREAFSFLLNIGGTFYYLCSILDGYSRYIVNTSGLPNQLPGAAHPRLGRFSSRFTSWSSLPLANVSANAVSGPPGAEVRAGDFTFR